jgi:hypothetical protein
VKGSIAEHLDALDERLARWAKWFREKIGAGAHQEQLAREFTATEHAELRAGGATEDDVQGYEAADPSYMAVGAASRYWKKYHPNVVS